MIVWDMSFREGHLRAVLAAIPALEFAPEAEFPGLLAAGGLAPSLLTASRQTLAVLGLEAALAHCRRHARTPEQFVRQFHQWFDAFRTLKFVHAIRDVGWPELSFDSLRLAKPTFWPVAASGEWEMDDLREAAARHWLWDRPAHTLT